MKGCYIIVLVVERYENKTQGYALLAQLVEQRTLNPRVQGSSPLKAHYKVPFLGFRPGDGAFFVI